MKKLFPALLLIPLLINLSTINAKAESNELLISSFETKNELKGFSFNKQSFSLSDLNFTHGAKSLLVKFEKNSQNDTFTKTVDFSPVNFNWKGFDYLSWSVFNSNNRSIYLAIHITDSKGKSDKRYFLLPPKASREIDLKLKDLITDFSAISNISFNIVNSKFLLSREEMSAELYFDDLRLRNIPLEINDFFVTSTIGFTRRMNIKAFSTVETNWKLLITKTNNEIIEELDFKKSKSPEWVYTLPKEDEYKFNLIAGDTVAKEFSVSTTSKDTGNKFWLWNNYPSENPDFYRTIIFDNVFNKPVIITRDQKGAVQFPLVSNFNGKLKINTYNENFNLKVYRTGYVNTTPPGSFYSTEKEGWLADPLYLIEEPFPINDGVMENLYIELKQAKKLKSGKYTERIDFELGDQKKVIDLEIEYFDINIPPSYSIKTAFSLYQDLVTEMYPDDSVKFIIQTLNLLNDHYISPDNLYRPLPLSIGEIKKISEIIDNTFTNLMYFDGRTLENWESFYPALKLAVEYLKNEKLTEQYYFYIFDEAGEESFKKIKETAMKLKQYFPEIKILTTSRLFLNENLKGQLPEIDEWIPVTRDFDVYELKGKYNWWYNMIINNPPYANWFIESDLIEPRILFWQSYQYGINGMLYYTANRWNQNKQPIDKNDFPLLEDWNPVSIFDVNGDGSLIYPEKEGVIPSLRLKNIMLGIQDYMLLKYAEEKLGREEVLELIKPVTRDMKNFTRNADTIYKVKKEILKKLKTLS